MATFFDWLALLGFVATAYPPVRISWLWYRNYHNQIRAAGLPEDAQAKVARFDSALRAALAHWNPRHHWLLFGGVATQVIGHAGRLLSS